MRLKFGNATILDGTGKDPFVGSEVVEGNRILSAGPASHAMGETPADETIDCRGKTIMPGLTEAHCHISFNNITSMQAVVAIQPEDHALISLSNAQLLPQRVFPACSAPLRPSHASMSQCATR